MNMKKNWVLGFLGIAVILFNYLGFSYSVKTAIMIALGLAVSFISFRGIIKDKLLARMNKSEEKNNGLQNKDEKASN